MLISFGLSHRDVRRSFEQGVVCGFVSKADHSLHLNPGDHQKLEWGDRLIVLANDGALLPISCPKFFTFLAMPAANWNQLYSYRW